MGKTILSEMIIAMENRKIKADSSSATCKKKAEEKKVERLAINTEELHHPDT